MSRPRHKRAIVVVAFALALCLLLATLLLLPDRDSLPALQKEIAETGTCSIPVGVAECVVQADTARIENDTLILERNAKTGHNSLVVVTMGANSIPARVVSIRLLTSPKDSLELTLLRDSEPALYGTGRPLSGMSVTRLRLDRHWTLRQRSRHLCAKIKRAFK